MPYSQFTLDTAMRAFSLRAVEAVLFPDLAPAPVPEWLSDLLARGTRLALLNEKARSEFIVAPVLLAAKALSGDRIAIFSGQTLDVDDARGLNGECDFVIALGPSVPPLRSPIVAVVEAKKGDIEAGLGQCVAQMVAAREFNARPPAAMYGCVTTGEAWQFLRLEGDTVAYNAQQLYRSDLGGVLAMFGRIVEAALAGPI